MKNNNLRRILFVCMGNICRSPTAEGVFRARLRASGLTLPVNHDSCGTHDYHIGEPPDRRAIAHAQRRNIDISDLRARQVQPTDFRRFDLILAADRSNLALLTRACPQEYRHKLHLMLDYSERWAGQEVPDPYYGGDAGFEQVLDMLDDMAEGLLRELRAEPPVE